MLERERREAVERRRDRLRRARDAEGLGETGAGGDAAVHQGISLGWAPAMVKLGGCKYGSPMIRDVADSCLMLLDFDCGSGIFH